MLSHELAGLEARRKMIKVFRIGMQTRWLGIWAAAIAGITLVTLAIASGQTSDTIRKVFGPIDVAVTGKAGRMTVTIVRPNTAPQVVALDSSGAPRDITMFEQSRLIISSVLQPLAEMAIIDLSSASLVDHFYPGPAAISPTDRYIAFLAATPRWRGDSAVYFVYDVTTGRDNNRMANIGPPDRIGKPEPNEIQWAAGRAFYPAINRERQTYERSYETTAGDASGTFGPWHEQQS